MPEGRKLHRSHQNTGVVLRIKEQPVSSEREGIEVAVGLHQDPNLFRISGPLIFVETVADGLVLVLQRVNVKPDLGRILFVQQDSVHNSGQPPPCRRE